MDSRLRCVRFFDAAADVTHAFNVGAVDLWPTLKSKVGLDSNAEALILNINKDLFDLNFKIIRRMMIEWRRPVDPIKLSGELNAIEFDLRMVEFEQEAVQVALKQQNPSAQTIAVLNGDNDVADFAGQWFSGQGGVIARRREFRKIWLPAVGVKSFDFSKKSDRVALGQAYVLFVHGYGLEDYKKFKQTGKAPAPSCSGTIPLTPAKSATVPASDVQRSLYVANALFQARRGKPELPILAVVAFEGAIAGLGQDTLDNILTDVHSATRRKLDELAEVGLRDVLDDRTLDRVLVTEAISAIARRDPDLAARLQRAQASWDSGADDAERVGAFRSVKVAALEALHQKAKIDPPFADAIARTITQAARLSPSDSLDELAAKTPDFASQPVVKVILSSIAAGDHGELRVDKEVVNRIADSGLIPMSDATKGAITALSSENPAGDIGELAIASLGDAAGFDAKKVVVAARSLRDGLTLGNGDSAIYLASTVAGFFDQRIARDIQQVGGVAIMALKAVNGYRDTSYLGPGAMGVGAVAVTGNYIGAALALAGMFGARGETPDPPIELLTALREDVQQMRKEMHARFDSIDRRLDRIYDRLDTGLSQLQESVNTVANDLGAVKNDLSRVREDFISLQSKTLLELRAVADEVAEVLVAGCTNWADIATTVELPVEKFVECLGQLSKIATTRARDTPDNINLSYSLIAGRMQFDESRLTRLPWLLSLAERLQTPIIPDVERAQLVQPDRWAGAATHYMRLVRQWPNRWQEAQLSNFEDTIITPGQNLRKALQALRAAASVGTSLAALDANQQSGLALWSQATDSLEAALNSRMRSADDVWADKDVRGCEAFGFLTSLQHIDLENAPLKLPAALPWPSDLQSSRRTNVADIHWCVSEVLDADKPSIPKVLLLGIVLVNAADNRWEMVTAWQLTGSESVPHPQFVGPGVGINPGHMEPSYGDFIRSVWADLLHTEASRPGRGAMETIDSTFILDNTALEQASAFRSVLRQADDDWIYERLSKQPPTGSAVEMGDISTILTREIAFTVARREVEANDALQSLLGDSAPLLSVGSLTGYRAKFPPREALDITKKRQAATWQLFMKSAQASALITPGGVSEEIDEILMQAEGLMKEAAAECRVGKRSAASCDINLDDW